jgi:hypothetical protein
MRRRSGAGETASGGAGDHTRPAAASAASDSSEDSGEDIDRGGDGGAHRGGGARNERSRADHLAVGAEVQIHGLSGSMEHNGSRGHLLCYDEEKGRWEVQITVGERGKILLLKPANLLSAMANESRAAAGEKSVDLPGADPRLEVGAVVQVHSLQSAPEHNGCCCILERIDSARGRWEARTVPTSGKGRVLALKPANMAWVLSAADRAQGMKLRPPKGNE